MIGLLALDVSLWGGPGAHSPLRLVSPGVGGSDWVLRPSPGKLWSSESATELELGGKCDRGEDGCDCERASHE